MSDKEIRPGTGYIVAIADEGGYRDGLPVKKIEPFAFKRAKAAAEARKAAAANGQNGSGKETKSTN
ncbi:hypothetical protein HY345_01680 [Candidatus Microgenomates bacterium]|nr:hypothetical protein [Candidatus Microgenomates bacterium]